MLNKHDTLKAAKEILLQYGWTKRTMGNEWKGYCTIGAVIKVRSRIDTDSLGAYRALQAAINSDVPYISIAEWNDQPERTKEDVLAVLDKAIAATKPWWKFWG